MKKVFALVFTTLVIAGGAAPTFAATAYSHTTTTASHRMDHRQYDSHCVFKNKSLCEVKSLSPTVNDNGDD